MNRFTVPLVSVLILFSHPLSAKILDLPSRTATLENGLRVVMVQYPSPGVVAYQLPVHVGSRNEIEKGKTGFAHFFEHLMFRGTKNMSGEEFGNLYTKLGCENNAWTWFDMTNYHGVVAKEYLDQILTAEADRFMNLYFDEKGLRDEAGSIVGEYNKSVASPRFVLEEKLLALAFKDHPYAHTTMGYKEDILNYPELYQDVWPFFKRYYQPGNTTVVLVGDVGDFDKIFAVVKNAFGSWKPSGLEQPQVPKEPEQTEARFQEITIKKPTPVYATVAYKAPRFSTKTKDSAALAVIAQIYFSKTSEFQNLYYFKNAWVDMVAAEPIETVDPYLWTIELRFTEKGSNHVGELLSAIDTTMAKIQKVGPTASQLAQYKKKLRNQAITQWFSSPENLADRVAWYLNFEDDLGILDRYFEQIQNLTAEDIRIFAVTHFRKNRQTTVVLKGVEK